MDRLAACHLMHGFLHVSGSDRGHHASAPNCQNVKRSLSLADRRGLISNGRGGARGLISPPAATASVARSGARCATAPEDEWEGLARRMHGHSLTRRMREWGVPMVAPDAMGTAMPFPAMGFGTGVNGIESARARRRGRSAAAARDTTPAQPFPWARDSSAGQLLVSLQYCASNGQLYVHVVRASGLQHASGPPSLALWLLRADPDAVVEKREASSSGIVGARRCSSPVFDAHFVFQVEPAEMNQLALVVMVMDSVVELGHCMLGELQGVREAGARHWRETLARPERAVAQWHRLSTEW